MVVQALKQITMETEASWARENYPDKLRLCTVLETEEKTPELEKCAALSAERAKKVLADTKESYNKLPGSVPEPTSTSGASATGRLRLRLLQGALSRGHLGFRRRLRHWEGLASWQ